MNKSNNMFASMYEVKLDQELGQYVIQVVGTDSANDFAIVCNDEFEAKSLCTQITLQMIPTPNENPVNYKSHGLHPNGHTQLYILKK